ncbi:MAG: AAA family ATPase [Terriglobales bacterium]
MKTLAQEFREIRRVATPWCVVQTTDYRVTVRELSKVRLNGEENPCVVVWNCIDGPVSSDDSVDLKGGDMAPFEVPPFMVLHNALKRLPENGILFWVVPDDSSLPNHSWTNQLTVQAVANLRDEFKANRRTLVILSIDGKLPPLFSDDVPLLKDPLPTEQELVVIADGLVEDANKKLAEKQRWLVKIDGETISKAAKLCRGMNRFAAEEAVSRNLNKGRLDLENLALAQRLVIEQTSERALTFYRGAETFDDIGGLDQIKAFTHDLFNGQEPPRVIVQIEEIEKAMAGSGSGFGDSTGVSQDQLGVLLSEMEDNDWVGFLLVGHAGCSKSLLSKAMGNTHKIPTLRLDLGACMGQYVGQSQQKIRKNMGILRAFAGDGAFFIGTSNDLGVIPPALRRRFRYGVWMSDLPHRDEREAIWSINLKKFALDAEQDRPKDDDWTGSDIRNVCDLAYRLRCPLTRAATYIVPVSKSDPSAIEKLRASANGKFLSVSVPGAYARPEAKKGRAAPL